MRQDLMERCDRCDSCRWVARTIHTDRRWLARTPVAAGLGQPGLQGRRRVPVPKMPEGFHANAENELSWKINEKEATD
jgi:hypothetical protein